MTLGDQWVTYYSVTTISGFYAWSKNGQGPMINGENAKLGHCLCRGPEGFSTPAGAKKLDPWIFFLGELYHRSTLVFHKKKREISSNFYHPNMSPLNSAIFWGYSTGCWLSKTCRTSDHDSYDIYHLLVLNVGNGWVAGGCWDDEITSDDWDHSRKFPAFSTSK